MFLSAEGPVVAMPMRGGRMRFLAQVHTPATPANPSANSFPSFSFTGGGGSGDQCQLDGGSFTSCSSPLAYGSLSGGSHTFKFGMYYNRDFKTQTGNWGLEGSINFSPSASM